MQASFSELEYSAKKKRTKRDIFLSQLDAVTPWAQIVSQIEPFYPRGKGPGRPPIGLEKMLRMYVAQHCFALSDEGIEEALYDSQAIRAFVGIDLSRESAPDATTLLHFRHLLDEHRLSKVLFDTVNAHLGEQGLLMRPGRRRLLGADKLGRLLQSYERVKASLRAKVEHPFHVLKNLFGHRKTRYRGLKKNRAHLFSLFALVNLVLARRKLWALSARGAP